MFSGHCLCKSVSFKFQYDPMMHFKCHCSTCQIVFGNSLNALAMPEEELNIKGELRRYSIIGGSGNQLHYNFCSKCGVLIYNKPELLEGMIYIPAGLMKEQIEFSPTVELWSSNRPNGIEKTPTTIADFEDNGTVERLVELLENLEQRE